MTIGQNTQRCLLLTSQEMGPAGEIASLLGRLGLKTRRCAAPEDVAVELAGDGCRLVFLDASDGDADRLGILPSVRRVRPEMPILVVVRHGDVATAVRAMKAGACDCIETPVQPGRLLSAVREYGRVMPKSSGCPLTAMERTILQHLLDGRTSRQTAHALSRSCRTVETHRRRIMHKLNADNLVGLVKQAIWIGLVDPAGGWQGGHRGRERGHQPLRGEVS